MAKQELTFTILISPAQESFVEYPVTAKEKKLIDQAIEEGDSFDEVEELEDLYERVMEAARQKLEEDIDLTGDDIDVDDLDFTVDFSEEERKKSPSGAATPKRRYRRQPPHYEYRNGLLHDHGSTLFLKKQERNSVLCMHFI